MHSAQRKPEKKRKQKQDNAWERGNASLQFDLLLGFTWEVFFFPSGFSHFWQKQCENPKISTERSRVRASFCCCRLCRKLGCRNHSEVRWLCNNFVVLLIVQLPDSAAALSTSTAWRSQEVFGFSKTISRWFCVCCNYFSSPFWSRWNSLQIVWTNETNSTLYKVCVANSRDNGTSSGFDSVRKI